MDTKKIHLQCGRDSSTKDASIPEVYLCDGDVDDDLQADAVKGTAGQGQVKVNLGEGFIPMSEFNHCHMPEKIRNFTNYFFLKDIAKRVVCIFLPKFSKDRPDKFKLGPSGTKGTGFLLWISDGYAIVSTNRHVLYNNEEIKTAKLYLDFDKPNYEDAKNVKAGSGLGALRGNVSEDFTLALFSFHHSLPEAQIPVMIHKIPPQKPISAESFVKTVCVISHPLGQPKQISFGRVLSESLESGLFQHNAPTHPGSSGAPIVVFSPTKPEVPPNSIWYHISRDPVTNLKTSRLQVNNSELFEINLDFVGETDVLSAKADVRRAVQEKVYGSTYYIRLMSYWSCLGCAALQPHTLPASVQGGALTECRNLSVCGRTDAEYEKQTQRVLSKFSEKYRTMTEHILETFREDPKGRKAARNALHQLLDLVDEERDGNDLQSSSFLQLLHSTEECFCKAFMKLVASDPRLNGTQGEAPFLSPYAAPQRLSQDPTWPFGLRHLHSNLSSHAVNQCLLHRLRKPLCRLQPLAEIKADDSADDDFDETKTLCIKEIVGTVMISQVAGDLFCRRNSQGRGPPTDLAFAGRLEERTQECLELILDTLEEFVNVLDVDGAILNVICNNFFNPERSDPPTPTDTHARDRGGAEKKSEADVQNDSDEDIDDDPPAARRTPQQTECIERIRQLLDIRHRLSQEDLKSLVGHATQHYRQDHKDAEGSEDQRCGCGRPSIKGLLRAIRHVRELHQNRSRRQPGPMGSPAPGSEAKPGDGNQGKRHGDVSTPLQQGAAAQDPDRKSAERRNVRFHEGDASGVPLAAFRHTEGREFEKRTRPDVEYETNGSRPSDFEQQREQATRVRGVPDLDTGSQDFTLRKLLAQSRFAFLFYQKPVKEEDSEDDDESWLLEANIFSLRRLLIATEVFLYNCHQFLACLHGKLACPCEALQYGPKAPHRHCPQDQKAAAGPREAKGGNTGQNQAAREADTKTMADLVCSMRKPPAPLPAAGGRRSDDRRPLSAVGGQESYGTVEEVQEALWNVSAKLARSAGSFDDLEKLMRSDKRCLIAVMSAPETMNLLWREHCHAVFEGVLEDSSVSDEESADSSRSLMKHQKRLMVEFVQSSITVAGAGTGPTHHIEDTDFMAIVAVGWKRGDMAHFVMREVMEARMELLEWPTMAIHVLDPFLLSPRGQMILGARQELQPGEDWVDRVMNVMNAFVDRDREEQCSIL